MDAPISVKRLLEQVKARVEAPFAGICVVGEVSNLRDKGKHWYFTLKEEGAALQCAVWAGQQRLLGHAPRDGERVVLKGSLNLYVPGGSLTFAVTHCERAGLGDLQARLRQLEAELRVEGVFDHPKRPLPRFPRRIGVVAAVGGAALRDVLEVSQRRAPGLEVLVAPAAAQGDRCVPENLLALQEIQDPHWGCEVILLVRGGGSLEDLWGFNDPDLVRAVAGCRLPVVTGVGHEIDTTLVDLAADRRAATPSQAAELATPDRAMLGSELQRRVEALHARMAWRIAGQESTLNLLTDRRLLAADPVPAAQGKLNAFLHRLHLAHPQRRLDQAFARLALLRQRLGHAGAVVGHDADLPRVRESQRRLAPAATKALQRREQRLAVLSARLAGMDPRGPLKRGFALVADGAGRPVTSAKALASKANVSLQWLDGERSATLD
jgi:exodeoxyribonuclease VII large subunit